MRCFQGHDAPRRWIAALPAAPAQGFGWLARDRGRALEIAALSSMEDLMVREVWTTIVPKPLGEEVYIAKVAKGTAPNRWFAQRVINAVRAGLPVERLALEVVVLDGEPEENPTVIGSSTDAGNFVQSIVPRLASYQWQLTRLDW
jgi:hypothetical protein